MKNVMKLLICLFFSTMLATNLSAANPTKAQKKIAYTIKGLKLNDTQKKSMQALLASYLDEIHKAKAKYSALKDKYKSAIDNGTITDKAAKAILDAKFEYEQAEVRIKLKYLPKFSEVIPTKKVLYCYSLINDKMSKIEGKNSSSKSKSNDDDDDN